MSTYEHHRYVSARCVAVSISVYNRVFIDLCCHFVCYVARHLSSTTTNTSSNHRRNLSMQTLTTSLFGRLCSRSQRPIHWHLNSSFNDNIVDLVLRADFAARICNCSSHWSHHLRANNLRNRNFSYIDRNVPNPSFAIRFNATIYFGWYFTRCRLVHHSQCNFEMNMYLKLYELFGFQVKVVFSYTARKCHFICS